MGQIRRGRPVAQCWYHFYCLSTKHELEREREHELEPGLEREHELEHGSAPCLNARLMYDRNARLMYERNMANAEHELEREHGHEH